MRLALVPLLLTAAAAAQPPRPPSLREIALQNARYADGTPVVGVGQLQTEVEERRGVPLARVFAETVPVPFIDFALSRDLADELRRAQPRGVPWDVRLTVAALPADHPVRRVAFRPVFEVRRIEVLGADGAVTRTLTPAEPLPTPQGVFSRGPSRGPIRPDAPKFEPPLPPETPAAAPDRPAAGRTQTLVIGLLVAIGLLAVVLTVTVVVLLTRRPRREGRECEDDWEYDRARRDDRPTRGRKPGRISNRLPFRCPNCRFQTMLSRAEADARMICPECHAVNLLPGRVKYTGMSAGAVRGFVGAATGGGVGMVLVVVGLNAGPAGMGVVYLGAVVMTLGAASLGMAFGGLFRR